MQQFEQSNYEIMPREQTNMKNIYQEGIKPTTRTKTNLQRNCCWVLKANR